MATILIDAEVYTVDDEVALHRGVAYDHLYGGSEPVWSSGGDNYMEAKTISEYIKGRRFIRRPDGTKIIGLSKNVHDTLGWHVEAFDNMEAELSTLKYELLAAKIMKEEYKAALRMADAEYNYIKILCDVYKGELDIYRACNKSLQSLSLWGRIKYSITGLFKWY
tara:strand:- start:379 stop:873 length:495 start_codon:yes stop_codon:yes gene_type:complete